MNKENYHITLADIEAAENRIRSGLAITPCPQSVPLSEITGCEIYCKLEYLHRTGSFKERGARNALLQLDPEQKRKGVIAASAGNHALGLAYHAHLLGIPATVVMPVNAPLTKVANCRKLGAKVELHGQNIEEARGRAMQLQKEHELTYINGFNDAAIIAGQGTMGLEIYRQVPQAEVLVIPVGGGGLLAGAGTALKALNPKVEIIAVEPERAASYQAAVSAGHPVPVMMRPTLADGLAVPCVGARAFALARKVTDRLVLVSEKEIALAVLRLMELEKAVVEGAGAAPLAACLGALRAELKGKKVVLPLCGGNIDTNILGRIIERGLAADGRLCRFQAVISDRPGGLAHLARVLAETGASVVEIFHDRAFATEDVQEVNVQCVVETRDAQHIRELKAALAKAGFEANFPI